MKVKFNHIFLTIIGVSILWIKCPSEYSGYFSDLFAYFLVGAFIALLLIILVISVHKYETQNIRFDLIPVIILALFISSLFVIYNFDDADRLPIYMSVYQNNTNDYVQKHTGFYKIKLFKNSKYQVKQLLPEQCRQFMGSYRIKSDTIIFDDKILKKTDSIISNKYVIDKNKEFLYYIDLKKNKTDSCIRLSIDKQ